MIKTDMLMHEARYNHNHGQDGKFAPTGNNGATSTQGYASYNYSSDVDNAQPSISYGQNVRSEEQKEAVRAYTAGKDIDSYENINEYLNGRRSFEGADKEKIDSTIETLDSVMTGRTDSNMMVYRGIAISADQIDVGDSISNKGFTSTSAAKSVADDFAAYYGGTTISIKVPAGTPALFVGYNTGGDFDEAEVLFGRKATIRIVGKSGSDIIGEIAYE